MKAMRVVLPVLGILLLVTGIVFLIAASEGNTVFRVLIGAVLVLLGLYLVRTGLRKAAEKTVILRRELELTGDVSLQDLTCRSCSASLSADNVVAREGAIFVSCPFCGTEYQMEEAPKW